MDGYLKVKTRADISDLKKNLTKAKNELSKFKKDTDKLESKKLEIQAKLDIDDAEFDAKLKQIEKKRQIEIQANTVNGQIKGDVSSRINNKYDAKVNDLSIQMSKNAELAELKMRQIETQLVKNKSKQDELNNSIGKMNQQLDNTKYNTEAVEKSGNDVGNSINGIIRKVGKWALAVFGVRSAYTAIRTAMGVLTQYDSGMAANIEYITYALANTLKPVIELIINLVAKLLAYVNYLSKAWFGKELFVSANAFTSMKKSSAGIAKNVKQTEKSLASFDEINKLEDTSSDGDSDSGGGIVAPTVDLSNFENIEIPPWLEKIKEWGQWIIDHWKIILGVIAVTGAVFLGIKLASWLKDAKDVKDTVGGWSTTFKGFFDGLGKAAEAIAILGGLALVINSVTTLIDTFSQSGMTLGQVAGLLGIVLGELSGAFLILLGAMTLMTPSWQSIAAAAIIFAGFAAVILSVNELLQTMSESGMTVGDVGLVLAEVIGSLIVLVTALTVAAQFLQSPMAMAGLAILAASISAILLVVAATLPTILDACAKFINDIGPFVIELLTTIGELTDRLINSLGKNMPPIIQSVGDLFTKIFSGVSKVITSVGNVLVNILNSLKNLVTTVLSSILNFINQLGPSINNFVNNCISAVTKLINFLVSGIEYLVNRLVIDGVNGIINGINKIGKYVGFTIPQVAQFQIPRFVPRLAGGGIVDVPKTGVNIGGAIAGEAGPEGVLPLTNRETMSDLGREIGQWVTVKINLVNDMDGRVLNKRMLTIRERDSFARNGG